MQNYRNFAIDLAKQAGAIMRRNFTLGMKRGWKSDHTPLTETDTAINQLVIDSVKKNFPDHGVLAEEGSERTGKEEYTWVCDPVDGTIAFSHGIPVFAFLLALVRDGKSILGVAYDPMSERLMVGERGKGTTLNGKPVHVSADTSITHTVIEMESWKLATYNVSALFNILEEKQAKVIMMCSFGSPSMLVASGELSATIFPHNTPWDAAALAVIVEEAGGKATDLFGQDQRYDQPTKGFLASNGLVHDELLSIIQKNLSHAIPAS